MEKKETKETTKKTKKPKKTVDVENTISFSRLFPSKNKTDMFHSIANNPDVLCTVLPSKIRTIKGFDSIADAKENYTESGQYRTLISRFFTGAESNYNNAYDIALNVLVCCTGKKDFFDTAPLSLISIGVESIVNKLGETQKALFAKQIDEMLNSVIASSSPSFKGIKSTSIIEGIKHLELIPKLSRLVIIAVTWPLWDAYSSRTPEVKDTLEALAKILIPKSYWSSIGQTDAENSLESKEKALAASSIKKAMQHFSLGDFSACASECRLVLALVNCEDIVKGQAHYLLVKCVDEHDCEYDEYYDSAEFKRQALDLGCVEAQKEWDRSSIWSLEYKPARMLSSADMPQRVICNSKNSASDAFVSSLSDAFSQDEKLVCADYPAAIIDAVSGVKRIAIILVDDDLEKNFAQFISVLDHIQASDQTLKEHDMELDLFLRTDEDKYYSLIDLALKHAESRCIRVHLIDDNKAAAQQLLSRHPLFYHIQSFSSNELNESQKTINYVVVGDNTEKLTEWLVREAFWMGCFNYRGVTLNITVMSPLASKLESKMKGKFSGMFKSLDDLDDVSKVKFDFVQIVDISSCEIEKKLNELDTKRSSFYFVIAAQDSVDGLNTSKRLREWSIRKEIQKGNSITSTASLPIIAFYCSNDTVAHLSRSISVQSIDSGGSWYNNYRLIPFGMNSELYHYNNLANNIMDEISSCVDLQYSRVETTANADIVIAGLQKFYSRVYSRDSSLAVALSIPYRLFHMPDNDGSATKSDHIVPRGWSIMNGNAYTDSQSIKMMAEKFKRGLKDESTIEQLLVYEHARWCRYMLSRGWVKANPSETIAYMNSGNPKQQLFIASMHGCICPVEDLSLLQQEIYRRIKDEERKEKYAPDVEKSDAWDFFTAMDRSSIISTPDLMLRTWLQRIRVNTNELQQRMEEK